MINSRQYLATPCAFAMVMVMQVGIECVVHNFYANNRNKFEKSKSAVNEDHRKGDHAKDPAHQAENKDT